MYEEVKNFGLEKFYEPYIGNFGFTENELFVNMSKILMWLEKHEDYVLLHQHMEEYNGRDWYLSPSEML